MEVEAAQRVAARGDFQHRDAPDGVELRLVAAGDGLHHGADLAGEPFEFGEVVAVDFADEVGARAGHDFVEAQLDGLADEIALAGDFLGERGLHPGGEFGLGDDAAIDFAPLLARFEEDVGVADVWPHRVEGNLRRADAGEEAFDFRELRAEDLLGLFLQVERRAQPGAAAADELKRQVALVELRDEVRAQPREDPEREAEEREGRHHDEGAATEAEGEQRGVKALGLANEPVVLLGDFAREEGRAQHRHERDGQHQRAAQREHDHEGHRLEHLPRDAFQRENRDIDHRDDEDAEEHRAGDFLGGGQHAFEPLLRREHAAKLVLLFTEPADDVFHHHHRAINDEAEVNRAQAHQVAGDAEPHHAGHGQQHGERNGERNDDRRAPVAQQREEDDDHQQRALDEVRLDGADGGVDEVGAVVERFDADAGRELGLDFRKLVADGAGHEAAVLAHEHDGRAHERLVAVVRARAGAKAGADADGGDIADEYRLDAGTKAQGQHGDLVHLRDARVGADDDLLAAQFHQAAADVARVLGNLLRDFREAQADAQEPRRVGRDDDLLVVAAADVDLREAGGVPQERFDLVVVDELERAQLVHARGRLVRGRVRELDGVVVDFPEAGADGGEPGRESGGQRIQHALQPLADKLAKPVDVAAVGEHHRHLREAELGERT